MSDVVLVAIVAAVPVTITAVAGLIVSIQNGHKVEAAARTTQLLADAAAVQQQKIATAAAVKQQEIHVLVNSNLSKVKADLAEAIAEIAALHGLLRDLSEAHHVAAGKD